MARKLLTALGIFTLLIFGSCSRTADYLKVLEGNYSYSRGEYMDANFEYIQTKRTGRFRGRVAYNLGNVYHSLGESQAALDEWGAAAETEGDPELLYRIAFNRGVLSYELGAYQQAYSYFRQALRIDPEDLEAKANLEFCLRKLNPRDDGEKATEETSDEEAGQKLSEDGKRILEYMRRSSTTLLKPDYNPDQDDSVKDW